MDARASQESLDMRAKCAVGLKAQDWTQAVGVTLKGIDIVLML